MYATLSRQPATAIPMEVSDSLAGPAPLSGVELEEASPVDDAPPVLVAEGVVVELARGLSTSK